MSETEQMKKPREQDTVNAILQFLHAHRIPAWRVNSGAFRATYKGTTRFHRFGAVGMADIIGILPRHAMLRFRPLPVRQMEEGVFLAIEVKSATGRVMPAQGRFLDQVNAAGGKAFMARSVDDVAKALGL